MTDIQVLAWESSNTLVYDVGHSLGAFLTSPAAAGIAAIGAAAIAARAVDRTRRADTARANLTLATEKAAANDAARWQRFQWISDSKEQLGDLTFVRMLVQLESDAKKHPDKELAEFIAAVRRKTTSDQAARARERGTR